MARKKGGDKTNLFLLSIVGIVAIVGIVVLVMNAGGSGILSDSDLAGEATKAQAAARYAAMMERGDRIAFGSDCSSNADCPRGEVCGSMGICTTDLGAKAGLDKSRSAVSVQDWCQMRCESLQTVLEQTECLKGCDSLALRAEVGRTVGTTMADEEEGSWGNCYHTCCGFFGCSPERQAICAQQCHGKD